MWFSLSCTDSRVHTVCFVILACFMFCKAVIIIFWPVGGSPTIYKHNIDILWVKLMWQMSLQNNYLEIALLQSNIWNTPWGTSLCTAGVKCSTIFTSWLFVCILCWAGASHWIYCSLFFPQNNLHSCKVVGLKNTNFVPRDTKVLHIAEKRC